jgi:hypothetical protein
MKKMNTISIIALCFIFLGGVGAILLTIGQSISSTADKNDIINTTKSENAQLKNDLAEIKTERDSLSKNLELRDSNIRDQNKEIIALSEKLREKSDYIQEYLTGSQSFPYINYLETQNKQSNAKRIFFKINNDFNTPIYNLQVICFDYDLIESKLEKDFVPNKYIISYEKYMTCKVFHEKFDDLPPLTAITLQHEIPILEKRYYIVYSSRGKHVMEKIALVRVGNSLHFGAIVIRLEDMKVVKELFDDKVSDQTKQLLIKRLKTIPEILHFS